MPRKGGSGGQEMFRKGPRLWESTEILLAFALKDDEAPEGTPPPGLPELLSRRDAALKFVAQAENDDGYTQLHQVFHEFDIDLGDWLADLPHALASEKQVDEALDLLRKLQPLLDEVDVEADTAMILAEAGRRDEALAQVDKNLREAADGWTYVLAGDVLRKLGEKIRAQALYRKAQILSGDAEEIGVILKREIPLLEELGRAEEAKALREAMAALQEENPYGDEVSEDDDEEEFIPEPATAEPEPARNAPCPCGSGKKYKRCCGKAE